MQLSKLAVVPLFLLSCAGHAVNATSASANEEIFLSCAMIDSWLSEETLYYRWKLDIISKVAVRWNDGENLPRTEKYSVSMVGKYYHIVKILEKDKRYVETIGRNSGRLQANIIEGVDHVTMSYIHGRCSLDSAWREP